MQTVGFLMLSHKAGPAVLADQARIMVDAGAQCVYVVDSAGALILGDAQQRIQAVIEEIGHEAQVGFHGHQNLSLRIANSVLAYQAGARQIDGALCALGAGAGNSPTEVLAATFQRMGVATGLDLGEVLSAAEEVVRPFIPRLPWMDRASITQGYAGVYSSFLLPREVKQVGQHYSIALDAESGISESEVSRICAERTSTGCVQHPGPRRAPHHPQHPRPGKAVTVAVWHEGRTMGGPAYHDSFDFTITARTEDGEPFEQEVLSTRMRCEGRHDYQHEGAARL